MRRSVEGLTAALLLFGCEPKIETKIEREADRHEVTTAETHPAPPEKLPKLPVLDAVPDFRREVTQVSVGALRFETRLLVPTIAPREPVRVTIALTDGKMAGGKAETIDWPKTLKQLVVKVKGPGGAIELRKGKGTIVSASPRSLARDLRIPLSFRATGFDGPTFKPATRWESTGPWLEKVGRYEVTIAGELALGSGPRRFESGPVSVEVKEGLKTVDEIEAIASQAAEERLRLGARPSPSKLSLEDVAGNLVVRFSVAAQNEGGMMYDQRFIEAIVERKGELLSLRSSEIFTCVAEGTLIATPEGTRRIETLAIGDAVLGHDLATGRTTESHVEAIWPSFAEALIEVHPGLRVTGRHPIYADGAWVQAGALKSGARLLRLEGAPATASPRATGPGMVYDLSVGPPHNYFAGGLLVHNKSVETPEAADMRQNLEYRPASQPR